MEKANKIESLKASVANAFNKLGAFLVAKKHSIDGKALEAYVDKLYQDEHSKIKLNNVENIIRSTIRIRGTKR